MKFKSIKKVLEGKYIHRYDISYETEDGKNKVYEMISRDKNMTGKEDMENHPVDAVVLIMEDETGERILMNREFRMATGEFVYNFPAGLIDPGETPVESARRELKEETGLDILEVKEILRECYSAIGFSNEKNQCIVGVAGGEFAPSTSSVEEIQAAWYTKAEMRELLKTEAFAARSQIYAYLWSREL